MFVTLEQMVASLGEPVTVAGGDDDVLTVARWRHGDAEPVIEREADAVTVIVNLSNSQRVERRVDGRWQTTRSFPIGSFAVVDPDVGAAFKVKGDADVLQLLLPLSALDHAAHVGSVPSRFQATDAAVERCALQALVALDRDAGRDRLFLSQIAHRLALAVAAPAAVDASRAKGGLSPRSVRRLHDLIDARLVAGSASTLTLLDLATEVNLSVFHFAREFRRTIGATPYDYVLRQRLVLARSLIASSSMPLETIARRTGFKSTAHFGSAFRKKMGVTPASFRRALRADRARTSRADALHSGPGDESQCRLVLPPSNGSPEISARS